MLGEKLLNFALHPCAREIFQQKTLAVLMI